MDILAGEVWIQSYSSLRRLVLPGLEISPLPCYFPHSWKEKSEVKATVSVEAEPADSVSRADNRDATSTTKFSNSMNKSNEYARHISEK